MENSSSSFTSLLNSSKTSDDQYPTNQQHPPFPQSQHPIQFPPPPFPSNFHPQFPHMFSPFGAQSSTYPQFPATKGSYYGGPYHHNVVQYPIAGGESSPVGSRAFFEGSRGSRGDESSPVGSSSPISSPPQLHPIPAEGEDWSDVSPDETEKKEGRIHWSEDDNLRLVSSWLKNSNDPIHGNDKRGDRYWKEVAAEYNKHAPKNQRRKAGQCKNHWNKNITHVSKFNACYEKAQREHGSGESDEQVMDRAREEYKTLYNKKRAFPLEHWWKALKDQPKWGRAYPIEEMNKRTRLSTSGAYTSSNQDTEDADEVERRRPQGRNSAKSQQKSKEKCKSLCSEDSITNDSMQLFNELQLRKQVIAEKMADATLVQAEAAKAQAEADKDKAQADLLAFANLSLQITCTASSTSVQFPPKSDR